MLVCAFFIARNILNYHGLVFCGSHPFSGKVLCGECGGLFGSKVWHSTDQYRRVIWRCNNRYKQKGASSCGTPHLTQDILEQAFVNAFNQLLDDKARYITEMEEILPSITDTVNLDNEAAALSEELDVVTQLVRNCVEDNAHAARNQTEYRKKYDALVSRFEATQKRLDSVTSEKRDRVARKERILQFLDALRKSDKLVTEFDEALWCATVNTVTVHAQNIVFSFNDGYEITVEL